jgi:spore germination protein KA
VEPPDSEAVIRGPKEGFTENIRTNTSLIRRKIKNPNLVFENIVLGRQTNTIVELVYVDGIVNQDVLKELKRRISEIDTDSVLESGHIEQYIEENPLSPFSCMGVTQKPDILATRILEGRVAVLCDGTPHVLTIPEMFIENIHTGEDYYNRALFTTIIRILRIIGLFITIMLPGMYVAVVTFNQEMLPPVFLINIITSSQKTPMPAAAELFLMILMFELLKEAGTRLPKAVGSAITIVGSLIIGDAAVNAGIVSAPMVIVVALTAVTGFILPNLSEFIIIYRLVFLFLGSTMGLIGIGSGIVIMLTQLISANSFGIPILSSFSKNEMKDMVLRFPLWSLKYRPSSIAKNNVKRQKG